MFTGIIENTAKIIKIVSNGDSKELWIAHPDIAELKIDQSIAHNGICLTVDAIESDMYRVTAIPETIKKTTLGLWKPSEQVNTERCVKLGDRMDGHVVQGHVDTTTSILALNTIGESWEYTFSLPIEYAALIVEKGSITLDGISLTCHTITNTSFMVSIIPYTYHHTIVQFWKVGSQVNIEFDIIGKYCLRQVQIYNQK